MDRRACTFPDTGQAGAHDGLPAGVGPSEAGDILAAMLRIRAVEERIDAVYGRQDMKTPVHLCLGQEAAPAGVCAALRPGDAVFGTHRSHGHYLAMGGDLRALAAELYGRATGCSGGRGGSMHVIDPEHGVSGSSAIVGGGIPLAVGAALAFVCRGEDRVAAAFFGDGAADEGVFHESLNFAALHRLPVVFVLENNFYATSSHQSKRHARPDQAASMAGAYGIPARRLDGASALAVHQAARQAVDLARQGGGPSLLEVLACRWRGHVGPERDTEKGWRDPGEIASWEVCCPVARLGELLVAEGVLDRAGLDALRARAEAEVEAAFEAVQDDPYPEPSSLLDDVW